MNFSSFYTWLRDTFNIPPAPEKRGIAFAALFDGGIFPTEVGVEGLYPFVIGKEHNHQDEELDFMYVVKVSSTITPHYILAGTEVMDLDANLDEWVDGCMRYDEGRDPGGGERLRENLTQALIGLNNYSSLIGLFKGPLPADLAELYRGYNKQIEEGRVAYREYAEELAAFNKAVEPYLTPEMGDRYRAETNVK